VLEAMAGRRPGVQVYGDNYPPGGTCIRAYIHVCDLADVHVLDVAHRVMTHGAGDNSQQSPSAVLLIFHCFMRF
jgi:UDP-glucose 4-epimerase